MRFETASGLFVETGHAPDRPAVIGADRTLNWQAFRHEVDHFVAQARALGAEADCPITLCGHKEAAFVVALTGCLALGAPFLPIDIAVPLARRRQIEQQARPLLAYDCASGQFRRLEESPRPLAEKGLAYILFTSGSTGQPKGVQIGRESAAELARWLGESFGLPPAPVFFNLAPFNFDLSMVDSFGMLELGGTVVLNDADTQQNGPALAQRACDTGAQIWVSTPSAAFQRFLDPEFCAARMPDLTTFLFCGEVLPPAVPRTLRRRFPQARILNSYGPTEITVINTLVEITDDIMARYPVLPVGRSKPRAWVDIDPANGEILAFGENVMRGYLNRPDLDAEKMLRRNGRRGFRTGDLGRLEADGLLFCAGRLDDQIKLHGYRIELGEVDAALARLPGVAQAAAIALRKSDGAVIRLVGCYQPETGMEIGDWRQALGAALPAYMIPSEVLALPALPLTPNGKIDRRRLLELYSGNTRACDATNPSPAHS
ncbi:D-alanine--poly(phosphoribitol) ligase subunit 1 [mine drainage metagenome]|uniref:D-alanine--poly(Phosphoribitol) ligase subunit 1 n=1 Tax=mine drainage metagenome TaxID=410659 RepID=A0A1J5RTI9_9ZZZZ